MSGSSSRSSQAGDRKKRGQKASAKKQGRSASDANASEGTDLLGDAAAREALLASDKLYYRIGEVSRLTGVKAHVLRYWETEFRWMAPPKSRSKQRLYRKRDIEFVWLLKRLLWDERYTIAGARQRIQELGVDGALALLDDSTSSAAVSGKDGLVTDAASTAPPASSSSASSATSSQSESAGQTTSKSSLSPSLPTSSWVSFRAALGEMEEELIALKHSLQDGA